VLLTRSPLSPVPKDWFSLDLHVLSVPPAFVLSQDQTLREDECRRSGVNRGRRSVTLSSCSKAGVRVQSKLHRLRRGYVSHGMPKQADRGLDVKRLLLSFQRPG
jgi:hypothetical protein